MIELEEKLKLSDEIQLIKDSTFYSNVYFIYFKNRDIGFVNFLFWENNICYIHQLEIIDEYRKKGIGTKILLFLEEKFKQIKIVEISVFPLKEAETFWEKNGFHRKAEKESEIANLIFSKKIV